MRDGIRITSEKLQALRELVRGRHPNEPVEVKASDLRALLADLSERGSQLQQMREIGLSILEMEMSSPEHQRLWRLLLEKQWRW
jgi:hypothetical protein